MSRQSPYIPGADVSTEEREEFPLWPNRIGASKKEKKKKKKKKKKRDKQAGI